MLLTGAAVGSACADTRGFPAFFLGSFYIFFFKSVLTNCSDIPKRLCRSISGFGAAFQTGPETWLNNTQMWSCIFFIFFNKKKKKTHQEADEGKNRGEKEETPSSGSGWWPGELPAVGCN